MAHPLTKLINTRLEGPHTSLARESCPQLTTQLDELLQSVGEDLVHLEDQLSTVRQSLPIGQRHLASAQPWIDLRITVEHLITLIVRILAVLGSVVADWYLESLFGKRLDEAHDRSADFMIGPDWLSSAMTDRVRDLEGEISGARREWQRITSLVESVRSPADEWAILSNFAFFLARLFLSCGAVLDAMIRAELTPAVEHPR